MNSNKSYPHSEAFYKHLLATFVCFLVSLGVSQAQAQQVNTLKPFTSDGCSMSPDSSGLDADHKDNLLHCCVTHDVSYWQGGTQAQKKAADAQLYLCIKDASNEVVATIYYEAVRYFGISQLPTPFHWGYGWTTNRGYTPLNQQEQQKVDELYGQINWAQIYKKLL